jgi:hypothetical protein
MKEYNIGQIIRLKEPYKGYRTVILIEKREYKWLVEIVGSSLQMEFYEDDFEDND